jgi:hypothetical protein
VVAHARGCPHALMSFPCTRLFQDCMCVCVRACVCVCVWIYVCLCEYGAAHAWVIYTHARINMCLLQIQKKRLSGGQCSI